MYLCLSNLYKHLREQFELLHKNKLRGLSFSFLSLRRLSLHLHKITFSTPSSHVNVCLSSCLDIDTFTRIKSIDNKDLSQCFN